MPKPQPVVNTAIGSLSWHACPVLTSCTAESGSAPGAGATAAAKPDFSKEGVRLLLRQYYHKVDKGRPQHHTLDR